MSDEEKAYLLEAIVAWSDPQEDLQEDDNYAEVYVEFDKTRNEEVDIKEVVGDPEADSHTSFSLCDAILTMNWDGNFKDYKTGKIYQVLPEDYKINMDLG